MLKFFKKQKSPDQKPSSEVISLLERNDIFEVAITRRDDEVMSLRKLSRWLRN